jgi:hypothetical protein
VPAQLEKLAVHLQTILSPKNTNSVAAISMV